MILQLSPDHSECVVYEVMIDVHLKGFDPINQTPLASKKYPLPWRGRDWSLQGPTSC